MKNWRILTISAILCIIPIILACVSYNGNSYIFPAINLSYGMNAFGLIFNETYWISGDINVPVRGSSIGRNNLLGYSSNISIDFRDLYFCSNQSNQSDRIILNKGWNVIAFDFLENSTYNGDRNLTIEIGKNLLGNSAQKTISVNDMVFINSSGRRFTYPNWSNAITNISVIRLGVEQSVIPNAGENISNTTIIKSNEGFWITSTQKGNLTLVNVGGSRLNNLSYLYNNLWINNGSEEKNISDAIIAGWMVDTMWSYTGGTYVSSNTLYSWQGYYLNSLNNNNTLIRLNSSTSCYAYETAVSLNKIKEITFPAKPFYSLPTGTEQGKKINCIQMMLSG